MSVPFPPNTTFVLAGATSSGKSCWVHRFLKNISHMFSVTPTEKILYCYVVYQPLFDQMREDVPNLMFHRGLPDVEEIEALSGGHSLLILDDLMQEVVNSKTMQDLFCQYCHHMGISVMFLTQNLFQQGKYARTIALNTHVLVLMKNLRNASQIAHFARQLYPNRKGMLEEVYEDCMKTAYGYLVIDMSPHTDDQYRLRTHIFPGEHRTVYIPKKC